MKTKLYLNGKKTTKKRSKGNDWWREIKKDY